MSMRVLCAAVPFAAAVALLAAAGGGGIRLGVCDWTIGKAGDPAALALAGTLGLDGVQVSLVPEGDSLVLMRPEARRAYLEAAERTGVAIVSFAVGELNNVPLKSDPRAERWLEEAVDIAQVMGIGTILVPFFGKADLRNDAAGLEAVVRALRRLAPRAERNGVVLALESYLDAADNMKILERVASPAVRVYYDVANSQSVGYPLFDEIRRLGPRIVEIHAKDTKGLYGQGSMDFASVRRAMEDIGYRGWLVIEGTEMPLGLEKSVRHDVEFLRSLFAGK
ncbi:MAG TPA: sugar phosphate isomerase/epimerase family protein [Burkholderiales bacterium]|nr:sugar phosphate isomerase/epimerase family protein [Burkholderiales bacterium]